MRTIYEPRGRAGEYAGLACNLYQGCDHGCTYCYAPMILKTPAATFTQSRPRKGLLDQLQTDARELARKAEKRSILLCFTCDPYQAADIKYQYTRRALEILLPLGLNVTILTKGGDRSRRDFDLMQEYPDQVTYAATLVFTDEEQRRIYEPDAAPTLERMTVLAEAHSLGLSTWVSLEPVFDPEQSLELLQQTEAFVDLFKVGTLNYHPAAKEIDWHHFAHDVKGLAARLGKDIYLKDDLRKYL